MTQPPTLHYAASPPPPRRVPWGRLVAIAAVIGVLYWALRDWWAYFSIGQGGTPLRIYKIPLWWQGLESTVVALLATAVLYGLYRLGRRWLG